MSLSQAEVERYGRQLVLPEWSGAAQERLRGASALVVGAGALGSPVLLYLVAAGVGRVGIVDSDRVELSNLHRQPLHFTPDVGRLKAENAAAKLAFLNPEVQLEPYPVRLEDANAEAIVAGADVVVDCSDSFDTRYLVNDACCAQGVALVEAGVMGFHGLVLSVRPGRRPATAAPSPWPRRRAPCRRAGRPACSARWRAWWAASRRSRPSSCWPAWGLRSTPSSRSTASTLPTRVRTARRGDCPACARPRGGGLMRRWAGLARRVAGEVRRDVRAVRERDPAARGLGTTEILLTYAGVHALLSHRVAHAIHEAGVPLAPRALAALTRSVTGIEIHPAARIGEGLLIDHGVGVVIGETAEIGDRVTLYQGVTLGGTGFEQGKRHPTVEDDVVVGSGAKLLGPIHVGRASKIGANSVVIHDVPPRSTVVGNPGHPVRVEGAARGARRRLGPPPDPVADALAALAARVAELEALVEQRTGARPPGPAEVRPLRRARSGLGGRVGGVLGSFYSNRSCPPRTATAPARSTATCWASSW